ncbi:(2Fe-2S)-binding protein [Pelomonas aquatica]|jgi:bacterioferritin-associated ferredoxin|nr:(2Fe-2S)-binding protein [Pelomonas aquatica]
MRPIRIKLRVTMIVCVCHRVSDRDIAIAASSGCPNFEALQDDLRVATACGACRDCACAVFEESRVEGSAPRAHGVMLVKQRMAA